MREVTIAAIQMSCSRDVKENIEKAAKLIRAAAEAGAQIILPSELFERQYFCQERRYDYYDYAKPLSENDAVQSMKALAKELGVVIPVSFYEAGEGRQLFNSVAVIDADGEVLGIYRKTHIPDDHYYQEKFYFTPGNTGFKAFKTRYATIGVGICWDQWFPETARGMALKGAEILFYPTAIGSEPILECDSMPHWRRCMTGHAACNLMPVVAANRIGTEEVVPCAENGNQSSALTFTVLRLSQMRPERLLSRWTEYRRASYSTVLIWMSWRVRERAGDCSGTGGRRCMGRISLDYPNDCKFI